MFTLAALATASAALASPPAPPSAALNRAAASLDGKAQCVPFTWLPNDKGGARGAITVPVTVNGRALHLQLDTGADATSLYGRVAEGFGWAKAGDETFRASGFTVADTAVDRPTIYVNADMEADATMHGTLGLPALLGRVAVLDYPGKRFCRCCQSNANSSLHDAPRAGRAGA